ncbi:MAG: T9SS type A sorting domain-containing protein [Bacteroidia bacterium]|nr:T9SS type A sorting domain-containing protein [Bacteroidia bacterium]
MRSLIFLIFIFVFQSIHTQVVLNADGPGNTYNLITSVLAPGFNPIETPDCSHMAFGEHIDEIFDNELNTNVFRFFIHTTPDNDRCINFDRQRNEIKSYDKSPDNLLGIENETVVYKWKFKLEAGFQSSPNFTHLHQLKSVGGSLESMPMYTLTTRKGSPDRLELRYAETNSQVTLTQTDLAPFIDTWLDVTETIKYGASGTYQLEIKRVSDQSILFAYSNNSIINWRPGADFVRPKWGIYRSLINNQDLRDEEVLFANFSIEELETLSNEDVELEFDALKIIPNPANNTLNLIDIPEPYHLIQVFSMDGRKILEKNIGFATEARFDISSFSNGTYILNLIGKSIKQSKLVLIMH